MTSFYVKERLSDGKVYLDAKDVVTGEQLLETLKAKDWGEARELLCTNGFEMYEHKPGYGYRVPAGHRR
jgi:hypothetical protein